MRYWHELADSTIKRLRNKGTSWEEVMKRYKQPNWCRYIDALEGNFGCYLLVDFDIRPKISEEYCKNCECFVKGEL